LGIVVVLFLVEMFGYSCCVVSCRDVWV